MKRGAQESGGTGYSTFKDYPISVASKTGTAQTGIKDHSDNGAFACFAPTDDPQIAVVIYGERAGSGSNLGPVARAVLDAYFGTDAPDDTVRQENTVS
jgi:penicillin-binding protein 2